MQALKKNITFRLHISSRNVDLCGRKVSLPFSRTLHTGEWKMRKLIVLGLLLAASTGCGRGWFPHLFRGAPCNGLCSTAAPTPTLHNDCEGCSSGYAGYGDGGTVIGDGMEIGGYEGAIGSGTVIGTPGMSSIQGGPYIAPPATQGTAPGAH